MLITLRNFRKKFLYSVINILGLSIGLAAFFLILIWVQQELSYDAYHSASDRIYRTSLDFTSNGEKYESGVAPTALLPALLQEPAVENATLLFKPGGFRDPVIIIDGESHAEANLYYGDSSLLDVFDIEVISGNRSALLRPDQAMISESAAIRLFGNDRPLGSSFKMDGMDYEIAAVYRDMPPASHFHASMFVPFLSHPQSAPDRLTWGSANYAMYAKLFPGSDPEFLTQRINDRIRQDFGAQMDESNFVSVNVFPLQDIHLKAAPQTGLEPGGSYSSIYIFAAVGLLILLIACINYMNLATARATERAREVGVRKVMGAVRSQLILQFLSESYAFVIFSAGMAIGLIYFLLPVFSDLVGFQYTFDLIFAQQLPYWLLGIVLLIGFLSGTYPALVLSGFQPEKVLRATAITTNQGASLRRTLVVVQFVITVALITSTLLINRQLTYIQDKNLGYNKEEVLMLSNNRALSANFDYVANQFLNVPGVESVARGSESPVSVMGGYSIHTPSMAQDEYLLVKAIAVDEHYLETLDIEINNGRTFNKGDWEILEDTVYGFILNQKAAEEFFSPGEEVVGAPVLLNGRSGFVRGIAKDFHIAGLQEEIQPVVLFMEDQFSKVFVKVKTEDVQSALAGLGNIWSDVAPDQPFAYTFLNQQYSGLYQAELKFGKMIGIFSGLAIVLASLGLIGLISFLAVKKSREIGIRKVLGASIPDILMLLMKDFARLILIAILLAGPLSYFIMQKWFENFAYRVDLDIWPFILGAFIAVFIAFSMIFFQTYRSARANPVDSIKSE
jgi:putative ABC transport system permease protein